MVTVTTTVRESTAQVVLLDIDFKKMSGILTDEAMNMVMNRQQPLCKLTALKPLFLLASTDSDMWPVRWPPITLTWKGAKVRIILSVPRETSKKETCGARGREKRNYPKRVFQGKTKTISTQRKKRMGVKLRTGYESRTRVIVWIGILKVER